MNSIKSNIEKLISEVDSETNKFKILFIVPESAGDIFLSTSLLGSLHDLYDPCDVYFACKKQYFDLLKNNPHIYKTIEYDPKIMDNQPIMEGNAEWQGLFDISIFAPVFAQKFFNYLNNGKSKLAFQIRKI